MDVADVVLHALHKNKTKTKRRAGHDLRKMHYARYINIQYLYLIFTLHSSMAHCHWTPCRVLFLSCVDKIAYVYMYAYNITETQSAVKQQAGKAEYTGIQEYGE